MVPNILHNIASNATILASTTTKDTLMVIILRLDIATTHYYSLLLSNILMNHLLQEDIPVIMAAIITPSSSQGITRILAVTSKITHGFNHCNSVKKKKK